MFIADLSGDEWDEAQGTEDWTNAVDRVNSGYIFYNYYDGGRNPEAFNC